MDKGTEALELRVLAGGERQEAAAELEAQRSETPLARVRPTGHVSMRAVSSVATPLAGKVRVEAVTLRGRGARGGLREWLHPRKAPLRLQTQPRDAATERELQVLLPAS